MRQQEHFCLIFCPSLDSRDRSKRGRSEQLSHTREREGPLETNGETDGEAGRNPDNPHNQLGANRARQRQARRPDGRSASATEGGRERPPASPPAGQSRASPLELL